MCRRWQDDCERRPKSSSVKAGGRNLSEVACVSRTLPAITQKRPSAQEPPKKAPAGCLLNREEVLEPAGELPSVGRIDVHVADRVAATLMNRIFGGQSLSLQR